MPEPSLRRRVGRPLTYDTQTSERITVSVTPAQLVELKQVARDNGLGVLPSLIRDAVTNYTATYLETYPHGRRR